jgi:hypothetical protein
MRNMLLIYNEELATNPQERRFLKRRLAVARGAG